jgi:serine O-acetyltransferase
VTLAGIVGMGTSLGVPDYLRRRVATHPDDAHADAGGALLMLTVISAVVALVLGAGLSVTGSLVSNAAVLQIGLASMVFMTAQSVLHSFLVGQERHSQFAWLNALSVIATAALGVGVLALSGGVHAFAAAATAGLLLTLIASWAVAGLRLTPGSFDLARWKRLFAGGLPFMGWNVALRIRREIDLVIVAAMLGERGAGLLAGAYRVIAVPFFIPNLIAVPLLPALSRCAQSESPEVFRHTLRQSLATVLALTIPLAALMIAFAPAIPQLLGWGEDFSQTVPLIVLLALAQPLAAADIVLGTSLFALNRERVWVRVAATAAIFNPTVNLAMIPLFERAMGNGSMGAALVEGLTELVMFFGALKLLPARVLDRWMLWFIARIVLASGVLGVVAWQLMPFGAIPAAVAAGVTFALTASALGALRLDALWRNRRDPLQAFHEMLPAPPMEEARVSRVREAHPSLREYLAGDVAAWARLWAPQYEGTSAEAARKLVVSLRLAGKLLWQHVGFRAVFLHRLSHVLHRARVRGVPQLLAQLNVMLHGLDIPAAVEIGPGLYVPHPVGTVVMARRIGRNLTLVSGVTIGMRHEHAFPEIGDGVYVGAGARILGGVRVGHGAKVGANAVVLEDVPDGATAVGVPARLIGPLPSQAHWAA